jgi:hypothetical protein
MAKFSINESVTTIPGDRFSQSFFSLTASVFYRQKLYKNVVATIKPFYSQGLSSVIKMKELSFGRNNIGLEIYFSIVY